MFYLLLGALIFVIQSLLVLSVRINIYPEFFFLPWLVSKGLMPYRDFFTHHGFLLDFFLAFPSFDKSLLLIKLFYFAIQSLNLILLLLILKKNGSKTGFVICGPLYVLLNFYLSENNLWYEEIIATFFLAIYYLLNLKELRGKPLILGTLVALVSFIKPSAAVILFPILFTTRKIRVLFYFFIYWIAIGVFFFLNHGLSQFIDELFSFNVYYASYIKNLNFFLIEKDFYQFVLFIFGLLLILILLSKKTRLNFPLLLFIATSVIFIFPAYSKVGLVPAAPFFVIYLGWGLKKINPPYKFLLIGILAYFLLFMGRKVKHQYWLYSNKPPYIEKTKTLITSLKSEVDLKDNIYVFGNEVEVYYFLNKLPPIHYPLNFPWIANYYSVEKQIISELKRKKIEHIIIPKPQTKEYLPLRSLKQFINKNYLMMKETNEFQLFLLKKKQLLEN